MENAICSCVFSLFGWYTLFCFLCLTKLSLTQVTVKTDYCGGYLTAGSGFFDSPGFPDGYPTDLECHWTVRASTRGATINLTSLFFYVEEQTSCLWDRVEIQDGEEVEGALHTFCGQQPIRFQSLHEEVHVRFYSDVSNGDAGFRIAYSEIHPAWTPTPVPRCNLTLSEMSGNVTSPFYPRPYPASTVCNYLLQAPGGFRVELEFDVLDMEASGCAYDYVSVYDGNSANSSRLGIFCGSELPPYILSTGGALWIHFVTDGFVQQTGFSAAYRMLAVTTTPTTRVPTPAWTTTAAPIVAFEGDQDCYQVMRQTQGTIASPGYPGRYPPAKTCVTVLRSDVISSFVFEFSFFDVEDGDNCTYDALTLLTYNTGAEVPSARVVLCGTGPQAGVVTLQGSEVKLLFTSDISISGGGYHGTFMAAPIAAEAGCSVPCENGGSCVRHVSENASFSWRCVCDEGFSGARCEVEALTCATVTCQNDGLCRQNRNGDGVVCECRPGYRGDRCQEAITTTDGIVFTKMPGNISVSLESTVLLECAVSDPEADVMWLYRDRILTESDRRSGVEVHPGGVVYIAEVQESHEGKYTCMAVTATELLERSTWLTIKESCSLAVERAPQNMTIREGETALFQCLVPAADVTMWRKDGDLVNQGPRKRMLVNNYLMVENVVETDAGEYTCAARNSEGCFAKVSAYLNVQTVGHGRGVWLTTRRCDQTRYSTMGRWSRDGGSARGEGVLPWGREARPDPVRHYDPSTIECRSAGECGKPKVNAFEGRSYRISSGREAPSGSAPWHVIIRETILNSAFCGGSLLNERWLVTAAHCVYQFADIYQYPFHPRHIQLFLATRNCKGEGGILRRLKSYIMHPEFEGSNFNNDLALFELDEPVMLSDDLMPICLERALFVDELLRGGRLGIVTGCGSLHEEGRSPLYLNEVKLPYVPRDICAERAEAVNASFTHGMMCAGYSRSMRGDACAGDSGGPYVMEYSGRFVLVGIVSWGVGCDRENQYGYYTHVSHYYDWIVQKTGRSK